MTRIGRAFTGISLLFVLAACGSSVPVRYYTLDVVEANYEEPAEGSKRLGLGPLRIPRYLSRSRMVVRGSNSEMLVDEFSRWLEPFDHMVHRIIAANVDGLLLDFDVGAFPYNYYADFDYQLIGRIDRFDPDQSGKVVLLVQWGIVTPELDVVVAPRRNHYEVQVSNPDDYGSIAAAMSEAIGQFSRSIARELEAVTD